MYRTFYILGKNVVELSVGIFYSILSVLLVIIILEIIITNKYLKFGILLGNMFIVTFNLWENHMNIQCQMNIHTIKIPLV